MEEPGDDGDERGFSAAAGACEERDLAGGGGEVDAAEDVDSGVAVAEVAVDLVAVDCGSVHERKTMAGSMRATRRAMMVTAAMVMAASAAQVPAATCGGRTMPRRKGSEAAARVVRAARPVPKAQPMERTKRP